MRLKTWPSMGQFPNRTMVRHLDCLEDAASNVEAHPGSLSSGGDAIDPVVIDNLRELGGGDEFVEQLIRDYIEDAEQFVRQIGEAVETLRFVRVS